MSSKRRLNRLERKFNPIKFGPICITWFEDEPQFKNKPQTKAEAIAYLNRRGSRDPNGPRDLVLIPLGSSPPTLRSYLMEKFDIGEQELH